jgi:gliding motility-associated-like protein
VSTSTKNIVVTPLPEVSFSGLPPTICLPATSITLTGLPAGGTFEGAGITGNNFNPGTAGPGNHTITYRYTNDKGCMVSSSQAVAIAATPVVDAGPNERICSGSFPLMLSGFSPAGGTWSGTGVSANGLFTPSEAIVGTHVLTYTVTNNFCTVSKTKTVMVDPTIKFTQGPDLTVCSDTTPFTITDVLPPGGTWSGNGVTAAGVFTPSSNLIGTQKLTYSITIGACSGISTKNIIVSPPPVIKAGAVPTECGTETSIQGFAPFTARFTNTSTGATSYLWEFGDGTTSTEAAPSHEYTRDGTYEVSLTAFFGNGCRVKQRLVSVTVEKKQMVPNIFTPNSDGLNDTFVPRITCLPTDLKIFNRWGQQVYEHKNYQNTWGGEGLSDGVYYYQLTSTKGQIWKGWVEIIR